MSVTKVILVDDNEMVRVGVRDFLSSLPGYKVVGEADSVRAGLRLIEAHRPDIVIMDIAIPGMDGIVATREILRCAPRARVIVLSAHGRVHDVVDAVNAGVVGYVLKADSLETLLHALEQTALGVPYIAPELRARLSEFVASRSNADALDVLSEREREIFRLAADCSTATEIANSLSISRKTVDAHMNRLLRKLGLRDRAQLVRLAVGIGLVHSIRGPTGEQRRPLAG